MLLNKRFSDSQLVEEIKAGNEEALVSMQKSYYAMVKSFILKNNGTEDEIDDVLQDSFIAVWRNVNKPHFSLTVKMSTYLMAIVKNSMVQTTQERKLGLQLLTNPLQEKITADDIKTDHLDHRIIHQMVAELRRDMHETFSVSSISTGSTTKSIAEKMGFANTDTVKSKKYQCFKRLQSCRND